MQKRPLRRTWDDLNLTRKEAKGHEMEGKEHSKAYVIGRRWAIGIGVSLAALVLPVNKAYVDYHVDLAQRVVTQAVAPIQESQKETSEKLDFLVKVQASKLVDDLQTQLVILKLQEPTPENRRAVAEMEQRIDRAEAYRDCVFQDRPNCDALRVFN